MKNWGKKRFCTAFRYFLAGCFSFKICHSKKKRRNDLKYVPKSPLFHLSSCVCFLCMYLVLGDQLEQLELDDFKRSERKSISFRPQTSKLRLDLGAQRASSEEHILTSELRVQCEENSYTSGPGLESEEANGKPNSPSLLLGKILPFGESAFSSLESGQKVQKHTCTANPFLHTQTHERAAHIVPQSDVLRFVSRCKRIPAAILVHAR